MFLILGLGNPGPAHVADRHNAGFMLVDWLAEQWGVEFRRESRFKAEIGRSSSGVRLLKPLTYMNLSGDAVVACATYFRIPVPAILVVHDELDLAPWTTRDKMHGHSCLC